MTSTKLILTSILATTILTAPNYNGCATLKPSGLCRECFERRLLPDGAGCGSALPKDDKCLLYEFDNTKNVSKCSACKPGYANKLTFNGTSITQKCVAATLTNCLLETDVDFGQRTERACIACPNNQYSVLNQTTLIGACQNITKPLPNCKWGSIYVPKITPPQCIRCNDGYAVNAQNKRCETTVGTGCWVQEEGKCIACNPFEGYSINANGTCFKTTAFVDSQSFNIRDSLTSLGIGGF